MDDNKKEVLETPEKTKCTIKDQSYTRYIMIVLFNILL